MREILKIQFLKTLKTFRMKTSNSNNKQTYSFAEIAQQLGVTEAEVIQEAKENGLIDENGQPTQFAINEGLLEIEVIETGFSSN